jgi:putative ABC transport system substrate-binding protein
MKRRALLVASGAWLAAVAARSFAQAPNAARRIVFLQPGTEAGWSLRMNTFRVALKELGHVEGRDISVEVRWGNDRTEALAGLAAEVVATNPAVIVTATSAAVAACKKATSTIPVVFATAADPVEQGFVASLGRPGGNITGVIVHSGLSAKIVEIAREALPRARRFAILVHDPDPVHKVHLENFSAAAPRFKFEPVVVHVVRVEDLDRAFRELAARKAEALFIPNIAFFTSQRDQIVERALKARLPLLSNQSVVSERGGLLSYGTAIEENYRRAASLVDRILRGAKPGDLAVEQPEKFELIVNMKTARAIGVKLSPTTMLRATKVIE